MPHLRRVPYTKPIPPGAEIVTRKGERFARFKRLGKTAEAPLTEDGTRIRLQSRKWYGEYRDADGKERCVPLAADRTRAEQMLAGLVREAELGREPLQVWVEVPLRQALDTLAARSGRPLAVEVAAALQQYLAGQGVWPPTAPSV